MSAIKFIKKLSFGFVILLLPFFNQAVAQLAPPNAMGTSMGHIHFMAADVEAANEFWSTFGAQEVQMGPLTMYTVPGVRILTQSGEPSTGSLDTMINHIGFLVPDTDAAWDRWEAAGINVEEGNFEGQFWVNGPEGSRLEIQQDPDQTVPLVFHHIHWFMEDVPAMQEWYSENFGATPGMRGPFQAGDIPGANLTYSESEEDLLPTAGTVLDHIGLEVADLRTTIARLEGNGITMDSGYQEIPGIAAIAFVTDPWGTRIELTQDLAQ